MYIRPRKLHIAIRPRKVKKAVAKKLNFTSLDKAMEYAFDGYSLQKIGISQSLLSNWTCRVKFLLRIAGWKDASKGKNTYFGDIVHHVLECIYTKKRWFSHQELAECLDKYISKKRKEYSVFSTYGLEFDALVIYTILKHYQNYYRDDFEDYNILKCEGVFGVSVHNALWRGKKDGLLQHKKTLTNILFEHKTMGTIREDILKRKLSIDKQNMFYILAELAENKNLKKLNEVLYNILRRPQIRVKQDESKEDFIARLDTDIQDRPDFYFLRYPVTYSNKDLEKFEDSTFNKLVEIELLLNKKLEIYRNEDACESSNNGAPYTCEFLQACSQDNMNGYIRDTNLFPELD